MVSASIPETSSFDALRISELGLDYRREPSVILTRFSNIVSILELLAFIQHLLSTFHEPRTILGTGALNECKNHRWFFSMGQTKVSGTEAETRQF